MNWRYAIGVTTIVGVLGVTAYSIYLHRKNMNAMSVDEAKDLVKDKVSQEDVDEALKEADDILEESTSYEEIHADFREAVKGLVRTPEEVERDEREEEEELLREEEERERELEPDELSMYNKEDRELRYDPNSQDAITQFMRMELAEWLPIDPTYETMMRLYDIPFVPTNDGDTTLYGVLVNNRAEFFGNNSKWNQRVTFADVILHYARKLDFNLGESYGFWVVELLGRAEFDDEGITDDILEEMVSEMTRHEYYTHGWDAYGLFALDKSAWEEAKRIASQNIDNAVTFEIEYNMFLKTYEG